LLVPNAVISVEPRFFPECLPSIEFTPNNHILAQPIKKPQISSLNGNSDDLITHIHIGFFIDKMPDTANIPK
jgi:hypothetical protein